MIIDKLTFILGAILLVASCKPSESLDKRLLGKWMMEKVYEYDNDVTSKHNPKNERWIEFKADGTFVSDGEPFGKNTGRWDADNDRMVLKIDSNVDDDDSEWKVEFEKDRTIWTGIGHPRKENTRIIHRREVD